MAEDNKTDVEEMVSQVFEDPDAPAKNDATPPQTIDAEPSAPDKDAR